MARAGLTVDRVVESAIATADEEGLAAVSMARVAKRLGFTTMSLYRHVSSKDELVRRMLDTALPVPPAYVAAGWRARLEQWSRALLAGLALHPWVIDVPITGVLGTNAQVAWFDRGLEALADTTLDEGSKAEIVLLVNGYVFWSARLRASLPAVVAGPLIPAAFDLAHYPFVRRAVESGAFEEDPAHDEEFAFGLDIVLDGVAALIARH